jgi:hypothetical protein
MNKLLDKEPTEFERQKDNRLPDAIAVLTKALQDDPEYYITWQANIAQSIILEFDKIKEERGVELAVEDIHGICNRGAKHFLNLLSK